VLSADETIAQVEEEVRLNDERAARMPAFTAEIDAVRGVATSRARDIKVEVDASGRITGLELTEQALAGGARRLAREILATATAAEVQAKQQAVLSVGRLLGEDDPITVQLRTEAENYQPATKTTQIPRRGARP
jgi:hypothetical protein